MLLSLLLIVTACNDSQEALQRRASELCQYIPDHELLTKSKAHMTPDFYAVLDTLFHMPECEAMDHEWLYYFVTGNGGTIAHYEVLSVAKSDERHAVATIRVRQEWEDGSFDEESDIEDHLLYMEKVDGRWLIADFDGHKADCIRHIEIMSKEQAVRNAMADYLVKEIGPLYLTADLCIPRIMIVAAEETDDSHARVWCDCALYWYQAAGDTLKTVSGGSHTGCMTLLSEQGKVVVTGFEQTVDGAGNDASAHRIFGPHYDIYHNMHSNPDVGTAAREEQLRQYIQRNRLSFRYYQDYGQEAVSL